MTWPEDPWDEPGADSTGFDAYSNGFDAYPNGFDADSNGFDAYPDEPPMLHWPLDWRGLHPQERWIWFEQLWSEVCVLRERYRLPVRAGWWENELQLETLAAFAAWVARYDSGEWDDPPGKLALLYDLERVATLLRDGADPFSPARDRGAFTRYLVALGCRPPPAPDVRQNGHLPDHPAGMNGHEPPDMRPS